MYTFGNQLMRDDGFVLGTFSSGWAACAAMIRVKDDSFTSLAGDKQEDLDEEIKVKQKL